MSSSTSSQHSLSSKRSWRKDAACSCTVKQVSVSRTYCFACERFSVRSGRSATLVAAYLMYAKDIEVDDALELIKKARPNVQ